MTDDRSILESLEASGFHAPRIRLRGEEAAERALRRSGRFRVLGELARGGVGSVLKARDVDLGRDVALKVLREDHAGNAELQQRFIEEAQIGGQLQHPGIVPVYELGLDDDDRPFFAMKLVKGQTLAALLKGRESQRRLLEVFEHVCRTVAYAHARGVVHRDLKPSNVMIGAFGEVLVVDWGFAKVLRRGGVADERRDSETSVAGTESVAGSVMGTPAYMPPEQARGRVDSLDARSDVFSLGAILCEILTGKPPYTGKALLAQAARADLTAAFRRLDDCEADAACTDLCREALATAQRERPPHAGVLADAVAEYLADVDRRAQQAVVAAAEARADADRAAADAARQRRARRHSVALAATVVAAIAIGGGSWAWIDARERGERERKAEVASRALAEAQSLRGAGRFDDAMGAANRAAALGSERADDLIETLRNDIIAAAERSRVHELRERIESIRSGWGRSANWGETDDAYAALFADLDAAAIDASPLRAELLTALDFWLLIRRDQRSRRFEPWDDIRRLADGVSQDPWRRELRRVFHARDRAALEAIADKADGELDLIGAMLSVLNAHPAAVRLYRRVYDEKAGDFRLNFNLAVALTRLPAPRREEAIRYFVAAIALRPGSYPAHKELAENLKAMGRFEEALTLAEDLARIDPAHPGGAFLRKDLLLRLGRLDSAGGDDLASLWLLYWVTQETRDLELRRDVTRRLATNWPDSAACNAVYVETLRARKEIDAAEQVLDPALGRWPGDGNLNFQLAFLLAGRGLGLDDCLAEYRRRVPEPTAYGRESFLAAIWSAYWRAGAAHLAAAEAGVRASPNHFAAYQRRAKSRLRLRKLHDALSDYRRALELQPDAHGVRNDLVSVLTRIGRTDEALETLPPALAAGEWRAHVAYVDLCTKTGKLDEAIAFYRANAATLKAATYYWHLALCLFRSNRDDEAVRVAREGMRVARWSPGLALNFGDALLKRGDPAGAAEAFAEAVRLRPRLANAHQALVEASIYSGDAATALRHARALIALQPKVAKSHYWLGYALGLTSSFEEAIQEKRLPGPFADGLALGFFSRGMGAEALAALEHGASRKTATRIHRATGKTEIGGRLGAAIAAAQPRHLIEAELAEWEKPGAVPRRIDTPGVSLAAWLVHPGLEKARADAELADLFARIRTLIGPATRDR